MMFTVVSVHTHWTAEAHMNSALVIAAIPNLIRQIESHVAHAPDPSCNLARRLIAGLRMYLERIQMAYHTDLGARPYLTRLYFAHDGLLGYFSMDIEPRSLLLQAESFALGRKRTVWPEAKDKLLAWEERGRRQHEKAGDSASMKASTSENGGIWHSISGQMVVGLATFDREAAMSLLRIFALDNFSRYYPNYVTGHWSAADPANGTGSRITAGFPRPDQGGCWTSFVSYCAHLHAWEISRWRKINESGSTERERDG